MTNVANGRIVRTLAGVMSAQGLTWLSTLVAVLFVPRFLGVDDFGRVSIALTLALLVSTFGTLGTSVYVVRETSRTPSTTNALVASVVALRVLTWFVLTVPALLAVSIIWEPTFWMPSGIALAGAGCGLILGTLTSAFQGNFLIGRIAPLLATMALLGTVFSVGSLMLGANLIGYMFVGMTWQVLTLLLIVAVYVKHFGIPTRSEFRPRLQILRDCRAFFSWDVGLLIYGKVDIIMLGLMLSTASVGHYALAYRLVSIPLFIPVIAATVLLPELSGTRVADDLRRLLTKCVTLALALAAPICVILAVLAFPLVRLSAGSAYDASGPVLILLALHMPLVTISTILAMAIAAVDRQSRWARVAWIAAVVNPMMNLVAIPLAEYVWGNGAAGAAFATLVTELLMTAGAVKIIGTYLDRRQFAAAAMRTLVVCAVGGVLLFASFSRFDFVTALGTAAVAFPILLVATKLVSPRELISAVVAAKTGTKPPPAAGGTQTLNFPSTPSN